jgi:hypothetical protein
MKDGLWRIFEYKGSLPRAFLTTDFEVANKTDTADRVFNTQTLAAHIIVNESPNVPNDPMAVGSATIEKVTADTVNVTTHSDKPMLLYLSDSYWPDFVCFVDGVKVPILEANFAYRAVSLPTGNHAVVFTYDTHKERIAFVIAGFAWLGASGIWLWKKNDTI